jgi:hypothetical protein
MPSAVTWIPGTDVRAQMACTQGNFEFLEARLRECLKSH